ncbi:MAG: GGDEF domain-containing protein [Butyrivibrio sp.]|jgi:diguanylate cyclase (GGDEF)-like protein|nr:GGDEF domain-containing protein [Butyrivibrio sp.]
MIMAKITYESMKLVANTASIPCTVISVEKKPDGSCGEVRFFAINDIFKKSYYDMFAQNENGDIPPYDDFEKSIEGELYTSHLPKEPNFEDECFKAAWNKEYINTYVDTTKMYGFWTQNILLPIVGESDDPNIAYCQFLYTLNKEMDSGKYAAVPPDIASFVIKACLELRNEKDFKSSLSVVTKDIRKYTNATTAAVITIDQDLKKYKMLSGDATGDATNPEKAFATISYDIVASWSSLLKETNSIIIKNENDMDEMEKKNPAWVATLHQYKVTSVCLVPFIHQQEIIGYLFITNFDTKNVIRVKETIELVSFFLSSEIANHLFLQRLEYLSNVDMLTGVYNRNCMNVNVDELALKLEFEPRPFSVAFCDLNGLKTINDNGGHDKGDRLLVNAAEVLKEVFKDDKIYRAGGDEFTIISFSSEDEFKEKIKLLREKASDPEWLHFAIGYYHDASNGNLRLAMRYADEQMYIDKDKFYKQYPNKRR